METLPYPYSIENEKAEVGLGTNPKMPYAAFWMVPMGYNSKILLVLNKTVIIPQ